jgi:diacylglycerol kinase (ATP)
MKKCLVLYSRVSGKRDFAKKIPYVQKKLRKRFDIVDFQCPYSAKEARIDACDARGKYDCLIVVGGDGTFNNVINALAKLPNPPALGYLNYGTIGDIGRSFGIGRNLTRGLKIITNGELTPFDVGEINGSYFAYVCTIGRYSDIAYLTPRAKKKALGRVAYYNAAVAELSDKKTVHASIDADGGHYEVDTPFLLLLNGRNIGGFKVNRFGSIQDGKMELYMAKQDITNGVFNILSHRKTIVLSAKNFTIKTDESMSWCIDGEEGPKGDANVVTHPSMFCIYAKRRHRKHF